MIERLVDTLRALAAPAEEQLARYPDFVVKADELALDFDDALRLVMDCPQIRLEAEQEHALERLDDTLERMSGEANASLWTARALREREEWAHVRRLARAALAALDHPADPPRPDEGPPESASDRPGNLATGG
jgi:hypothetical protein